jgi:tRNA threonylcarbamoyl adenosine modification protein (Sua5/YciO/YrdC/YwlC family)
MEFYELHPLDPQQRFINKAVKIIKDGGVIIYPTDTVYGIGCDIFNKVALERVFHIKNESNTKLFSFVCSDMKDIAKYARVSDYAYRMMKHLLPGPYTFILPASKTVPKTLWTKRKTVGIRIPNNHIALKLVEDVGNPIISTSVTTRKGQIMNDPDIIKVVFDKQVDLMLSSGFGKNTPSSIVDLSEDVPVISREGAGDVSLFLS